MKSCDRCRHKNVCKYATEYEIMLGQIDVERTSIMEPTIYCHEYIPEKRQVDRKPRSFSKYRK